MTSKPPSRPQRITDEGMALISATLAERDRRTMARKLVAPWKRADLPAAKDVPDMHKLAKKLGVSYFMVYRAARWLRSTGAVSKMRITLEETP